MQEITYVLEITAQIFTYLTSLLGFSPLLSIPVFVIVAIIAGFAKVKERWPKFKNFILASMVLITGVGLMFLVKTGMVWQETLVKGLILGSVSAISYQFFKDIVAWLFNKAMDRFTDDVNSTDLFDTGEKD